MPKYLLNKIIFINEALNTSKTIHKAQTLVLFHFHAFKTKWTKFHDTQVRLFTEYFR